MTDSRKVHIRYANKIETRWRHKFREICPDLGEIIMDECYNYAIESDSCGIEEAYILAYDLLTIGADASSILQRLKDRAPL